MKKTSETVVFFGSGPVAAGSLRSLAQDFDIEAVITKPSTVREMATITQDAPVHVVANGVELNDLIAKKPFKSRVGILVDFGVIVSQAVIDSFPLGIINSHFSLLPEWRGADPISFAILSGQKKTGVSLMRIVAKLDEGELLSQESFAIPPRCTTPKLTQSLLELSNAMLSRDIPLYFKGKRKPYQQPSEGVSYSRKLSKEDGIIDWHKPAESIEREIRAFIDWPKSRTTIAGKDVIITKAVVLPLKSSPGMITILDKKIVVFCAENALAIEQLKPAGKKEMTSEAFIAGHREHLK